MVTTWAVNESPPNFYRLDAIPVTQPTVSEDWRENIAFHELVQSKLNYGVFWPCLDH